MKARFLANENFPLPSVSLLRELGHDVATVPANAYQALKEAPSIGVHFHRQIKGQFRYARRT
jgi:hypothetical protein